MSVIGCDGLAIAIALALSGGILATVVSVIGCDAPKRTLSAGILAIEMSVIGCDRLTIAIALGAALRLGVLSCDRRCVIEQKNYQGILSPLLTDVARSLAHQ